MWPHGERGRGARGGGQFHVLTEVLDGWMDTGDRTAQTHTHTGVCEAGVIGVGPTGGSEAHWFATVLSCERSPVGETG